MSDSPTTNHQPLTTTTSHSAQLSNLKIAIVHDWLVGGGAEKVVLELHKLFPDAPIYTSYASSEWRKKLDDKVVTGYLQKWPFSKLRKYLPWLRQRWFKKLNLNDFDLVISSSGNGEAKFVLPKNTPTTNHQPPTTNVKRPIHVCYCHTPTHFYWRHYKNYLKNPGFGIFNPIAGLGLRLLVNPLRKRDFAAAQKVDYFIANSQHIKNDIKEFYGRDSIVVHPPVDVNRFQTTNHQPPTTKARHGFITVGRLVPNKRVDLIIRACDRLELSLTVIGKGPELSNLRKIASSNVRFINDASDTDIEQALASAEGFVFAGHEDFGIAPVEALASGTPVIAYKAGGALDYVMEGKTGTLFEQQTVDSLTAALKTFKTQKYNEKEIKSFAKKFSSDNIRQKVDEFLKSIT